MGNNIETIKYGDYSVTIKYPKQNLLNTNEVDMRSVNIEIETEEPLSKEFFDAFLNLLNAYTG